MDECKPLHRGDALDSQQARHRRRGGDPGRAVQVDPIKPTLKAPGTKRLKLEWDTLLSTSAFKFSLRRYTPNGEADSGTHAYLLITFGVFGVPVVGRCRLTACKPVLKAPMVSAISA